MDDKNQELKDQENQENEGRNHSAIIAGVMILVGLVLVGANLLGTTLDNWWALFMLIPAFFLLAAVWRDYKENGRLTSKSTGFLIASLAIFTMVAIFLFDLNWGVLWPLAFIFGGIAVLLGSRK